MLTPSFTRFPLAHLPLMQTMCRDYFQACETAEAQPNVEILGPVLEVFHKLQPPEEAPEP